MSSPLYVQFISSPISLIRTMMPMECRIFLIRAALFSHKKEPPKRLLLFHSVQKLSFQFKLETAVRPVNFH